MEGFFFLFLVERSIAGEAVGELQGVSGQAGQGGGEEAGKAHFVRGCLLDELR